LVLSACATTGAVEEQAERLDEFSSRIDAIDKRLASIEGRVQALNLPPDLSGDLATLDSDVSRLARDVQDLHQVADAAYSDAVSEVDDLRDCLNEYMDTIGRWSSNVNSYYDYYYC
jgi:outer membrane murein-binding lipoprotein Lpp